jgi:hypothetical protein
MISWGNFILYGIMLIMGLAFWYAIIERIVELI